MTESTNPELPPSSPFQGDVTEAVLIWTGWKEEHVMFPRRQYVFLIKRFGEKRASELFTFVRSLEDDFYTTDAKYTPKI